MKWRRALKRETARDEAAVQEALEASTHYEALGAPCDAPACILRECYLRRSVCVHPCKNSNADATEAFLRVNTAWVILQDERLRREYDRSVSAGLCLLDTTRTPVLSEKEAYAVFAMTVQECCMAACSETEDTLLVAQQLRALQSRQLDPSPEDQALTEAGLGLCQAGALYGIGVAASFAGCPGAGVCLRRVACSRGQEQLVMAATMPAGAVQDAAAQAYASATEIVQEAGQGLCQAVEGFCADTGFANTCLSKRPVGDPRLSNPESGGMNIIREANLQVPAQHSQRYPEAVDDFI
eukprot:TRINITY_DN82010_c0_g1_i1.p1 TRINITY_DN82010_c0_g1~~TRINITY_DN82010_c0_g1_i1.p1  ORF type:complete len:296 (+),score=44.97 TRINITY_DN82010_c0_g1_i1:76-963(+)